MNWFNELIGNHELVAQNVLILAVVAMVGLAIGQIKYRGLGLGIAGVLFVGLAAGQLGLRISEPVLHFARDFGLILFVYTIGVQVGPGFFSSLRRQGLPLNLMAAGVVLAGATTMVLLWKLLMTGPELAAAVGLLSGATTNTPSLASAQQALADMPGATAAARALPAQAYAISYPFGILGVILTMLIVRAIFRIDVASEIRNLEAEAARDVPRLTNANIEVNNPNLADVALGDLQLLSTSSVVVSRVYRAGQSSLARRDTRLRVGDVIHAVGVESAVNDLKKLVGRDARIDVRHVPSDIVAQRLLVSRSRVVNLSLAELAFPQRFGVNVTRITRSGVDLPVSPSSRLSAGDLITVVGEKHSIETLAREVGNSAKELNHPHLVGVFVGVALGVVVGSIPVLVPGLPAPFKLGLAAGPLLVAIALSHIGRVGPVMWYMPDSANLMLREVGIVLFLACVGLKGGQGFLETLHANGVLWIGIGALITLIPILLVAVLGRAVLRLNYLTLCGLLAGSMTDPPALAFAQNYLRHEGPSLSYATVYPLVMVLRVLSTQVIVLLLFPG